MSAFHAYGAWLASITWWRFGLLSVLLLIIANILQNLPPFTWTYTETIFEQPDLPRPPKAPAAPKAPVAPSFKGLKIEKPASGGSPSEGVDISIDHRGVRISPRGSEHAASAAAATAVAPVARNCRRAGFGNMRVIPVGRIGERCSMAPAARSGDPSTVR